MHLGLGKFGRAVTDFDRGLTERPGYAGSLYGRGLAKTRLGEPGQGEADLAAARSVEPGIAQRLARTGFTTDAVAPTVSPASAPR